MIGLRGLNLRDNDLTGTIPWQLGNMDSMQKLRLHNNRLSGAIPTQLADLENLTDLWLSGNELTGPIPSQLGGLANLSQLSLRNNQLSGAIPAELGNLADTLTHFYLVGNTGPDGLRAVGAVRRDQQRRIGHGAELLPVGGRGRFRGKARAAGPSIWGARLSVC